MFVRGAPKHPVPALQLPIEGGDDESDKNSPSKQLQEEAAGRERDQNRESVAILRRAASKRQVPIPTQDEEELGSIIVAVTHTETPRRTRTSEKADIEQRTQEQVPRHVESQPVRAGTFWTSDDDRLLVTLRTQGADRSQYRKAFPNRTVSSITNRYSKLRMGKVKKTLPAPFTEERPAKRSKSRNSGQEQRDFEPEHEEAGDTRTPTRKLEKSKASKSRRKSSPKRTIADTPIADTTRATRRTTAAAASRTQGVSAGTPTKRRQSRRIRAIDADEEQDSGHITASRNDGTQHNEHEPGHEFGYEPDDEPELEPDVEGTPEIDIQNAKIDMFGQEALIAKIFQAAVEHNTLMRATRFSDRGEIELPVVRSIRLNKDKIRESYKGLSNSNETARIYSAISRSLGQLETQVKQLDVEGCRDDEERLELVTQVNQLVFVDLLSILGTAINAHTDIESDVDTEDWQLDQWIQICQIIVDLKRKSYSETWKQFKIHGIKGIRNNLLGPLTTVLANLKRERKARSQFRNQSTQSELLRQVSQRQEIEDEEERRLGREYDEKRRRLVGLFARRIGVAKRLNSSYGRLKMHGKTYDEWRQEREPSHGTTELDANGEPMERLPIFAVRRPGWRPPRFSSSNAEDTEWTKREKLALLEGLRAFSGPKVFHNLFVYYCRPGGELSERTVSEILWKAVSIRQVYITEHEGEEEAQHEVDKVDSRCPLWLKDLPDLDLIELL